MNAEIGFSSQDQDSDLSVETKPLSIGMYRDPSVELVRQLNNNFPEIKARSIETLLCALRLAGLAPVETECNNPTSPQTTTPERLVNMVSNGVIEWLKISDEEQLNIWHKLRNHTSASREVPPVIRMVAVMAGRRHTELGREIFTECLPEEVYEIACGTYWMLVEIDRSKPQI